MSHPTNDELLELVLGGEEGSAAVDGHVKTCVECSVRFAEVRQEQELLKSAFRMVPARDTLRRKVSGPAASRRAAVAAAILIFAIGGAVAFRLGMASAASGRRQTPVALERKHRELYAVVQKIEDTREGLLRPVDGQKSQQYVDLLTKEEELYADSLEGALDPVSPLTREQSAALRSAVREYSARAWLRAEALQLAASFRHRVRDLLNDAQFQAFEEYAAAEKEWDRESDIDRFAADLAQQFDLRFSETQRVRETLQAHYPSEDLPLFCLALNVGDMLLDRPPLTLALRNALEPEHRGPLDVFLLGIKQSRDEADRIVRLYSRGH